jgi:hypothetical protein
MIFTENSWKTVSAERIAPKSFLDKIKTPWRPQIVDRGFLGYYAFRNMFGADKGGISHTSYQIDSVWPDGGWVKTGANDQGLFVLPSKDLVIGWFGAHNQSSTPTQTWGRAIANSPLWDEGGSKM